MTHYYFDADAQVKVHLAEAGSAWVRRLAAATSVDGAPLHDLYTVDVSVVEVAAAIAVAQRMGRIDAETRVAAFERHIDQIAQLYVLIPAESSLQMEAAELTQNRPLKALDALHLAAALRLDRELSLHQISLTLVSSDHQLLNAARREGLLTEDPQDYEAAAR